MPSIERRRPAFFPAWFGSDWPDLWPDFARLPGAEPLKVEEFVDEGALVIKAEMPGIDPEEDVEITVEDGRLHIRATRQQETKVEEKDHYRSEFRYGSFTRVLPLPAGAGEEDVQADYADGILEIRVPIREQPTEARKIQVNRRS